MMLPILLFILAEAAPIQPVDHDFMGKYLAATLAFGGLLTLLGFQIGKKRVSVSFEEQFVTRREFERLESQVTTNMAEVKGLFAQTMQAVKEGNAATDRRIENQNKRLSEQIATVAKAAYDGRKGIWAKVNEKSESLAKLEERTNLVDGLARLGEVLVTAIEKRDGQ